MYYCCNILGLKLFKIYSKKKSLLLGLIRMEERPLSILDNCPSSIGTFLMGVISLYILFKGMI